MISKELGNGLQLLRESCPRSREYKRQGIKDEWFRLGRRVKKEEQICYPSEVYRELTMV